MDAPRAVDDQRFPCSPRVERALWTSKRGSDGPVRQSTPRISICASEELSCAAARRSAPRSGAHPAIRPSVRGADREPRLGLAAHDDPRLRLRSALRARSALENSKRKSTRRVISLDLAHLDTAGPGHAGREGSSGGRGAPVGKARVAAWTGPSYRGTGPSSTTNATAESLS